MKFGNWYHIGNGRNNSIPTCNPSCKGLCEITRINRGYIGIDGWNPNKSGNLDKPRDRAEQWLSINTSCMSINCGWPRRTEKKRRGWISSYQYSSNESNPFVLSSNCISSLSFRAREIKIICTNLLIFLLQTRRFSWKNGATDIRTTPFSYSYNPPFLIRTTPWPLCIYILSGQQLRRRTHNTLAVALYSTGRVRIDAIAYFQLY